MDKAPTIVSPTRTAAHRGDGLLVGCVWVVAMPVVARGMVVHAIGIEPHAIPGYGTTSTRIRAQEPGGALLLSRAGTGRNRATADLPLTEAPTTGVAASAQHLSGADTAPPPPRHG